MFSTNKMHVRGFELPNRSNDKGVSDKESRKGYKDQDDIARVSDNADILSENLVNIKVKFKQIKRLIQPTEFSAKSGNESVAKHDKESELRNSVGDIVADFNDYYNIWYKEEDDTGITPAGRVRTLRNRGFDEYNSPQSFGQYTAYRNYQNENIEKIKKTLSSIATMIEEIKGIIVRSSDKKMKNRVIRKLYKYINYIYDLMSQADGFNEYQYLNLEKEFSDKIQFFYDEKCKELEALLAYEQHEEKDEIKKVHPLSCFEAVFIYWKVSIGNFSGHKGHEKEL